MSSSTLDAHTTRRTTDVRERASVRACVRTCVCCNSSFPDRPAAWHGMAERAECDCGRDRVASDSPSPAGLARVCDQAAARFVGFFCVCNLPST